MPEALRSALASRPTVEVEAKAEAGKPAEAGATLLVPLGPSPFHRLLLHALCQYRRLRSRSESIRFLTPPPSWASVDLLSFAALSFLLFSGRSFG